MFYTVKCVVEYYLEKYKDICVFIQKCYTITYTTTVNLKDLTWSKKPQLGVLNC